MSGSSSEMLRHYVAARVLNDEAVVIEARDTESSIRLLGSTMRTSTPLTKGHGMGEKYFVIYPEKGKEGYVAITVRGFRGYGHKGAANHVYIPAFLRLTWKEGEDGVYPFIDLENPWLPSQLAGQAKEGCVEVNIRGRWFSSYERFTYTQDQDQDKVQPSYVPDGSLLLRYLVGEVPASSVIHAAVERKVEVAAPQRIEGLTREVAGLLWELQESQQTLVQYKEYCDSIVNIRHEMYWLEEDLRKKNAEIESLRRDLAEHQKSWWDYIRMFFAT